MNPEDYARLLETRGIPMHGFEPTVLSCAHCSAGDALDLREKQSHRYKDCKARAERDSLRIVVQ